MQRLKDKVAVVTGGSSGIGKAVALRYLREGARVVAVARDPAKLAALEAEVGDPDRLLVLSGDMSVVEDGEDVIESCVRRFGRIDILFNNAGGSIESGRRLHDLTVEGWDYVMNLNVRGLFVTMRATVRHMMRQGGGSILNTSSIGGDRAISHAAPYLTAKAAVIQLSKAAALDFCKDNIRVNALCPGRTDTPALRSKPAHLMDPLIAAIPMGRLGTSDEVAGLAAFLASDDASYCTGGVYAVDGGVLAGNATS